MTLTRAQIEAAAPDQAALKAASALLKPGKWGGLGRSDDGALVWGECQGSGANPYRVVADLTDAGSKCSCPSRKFPCKHGLALMWLAVDGAQFTLHETPAWVSEWVGRRRKTSSAPSGANPGDKSLEAALLETPPPPRDPAADARKAAASAKRAEETRSAILAATEELDRWAADQLRAGLTTFVAEAHDRCRRIAARMVDGKASALASRLDELPARLLALPAPERPDAALVELGKLALLCRAWRATPGDPELRREIATTESREELLSNPSALQCESIWEVVAEQVSTRRDGLVSVATWLLNLRSEGPRFGLLLDFFPASAGRRSAAFAAGNQFEASLAFYPARAPLRAVVRERGVSQSESTSWPSSDADDPLAPACERLHEAPWALETPLLLPPGRLASESSGRAWWRSGEHALPLASEPPPLAMGTALSSAVGIWSGARLMLLAAQSEWGRLDLCTT